VAELPSEADLEHALWCIYEAIGQNCGYWARRFYQWFTPDCKKYIGGVGAVRRVLCAGRHSGGLDVLRKANRLDLSVERLVLDPKWSHLFDDDDRALARLNLRPY
jgi:hypothetical protein